MERVSSRGNPYHHPAGSPKGGQFASKGTSNSTISEKTDEQYEAATENRRVESVLTFTPAETKEEAVAFANGLGVEVDYSEFTVEQCNVVNRVLEETFVEFPETRKSLRFIGSAESHMKEISTENLSIIKQQYIEDGMPEKVAEKLVAIESKLADMTERMGAHYAVVESIDGDNRNLHMFLHPMEIVEHDNDGPIARMKQLLKGKFRRTAYHEFGHVIAMTYSPDEGEEFSKQFSKMEVVTGLSTYAATTHCELMAEGWAEYKTRKRPRRIALAIGKYLRSLR